jgi:anti-sigma factor RsiW
MANPSAWQCKPLDSRLTAYLDGELDDQESRALKAHLVSCARCSSDLEQQRTARQALRNAAPLIQPPPGAYERVQASLRQAKLPPTRRRSALVAGGLAALFALIALLSISWLNNRLPSSALRQVVAAHEHETNSSAPVSLVSSDPEQISNWTRTQLRASIDVPALDAAGYRLLGARTEPSISRQALSLVYEGTDGRLTCTILPGDIPLQSRLALPGSSSVFTGRVDGVSIAGWADRDATYIMAADAPIPSVARLARLASRTSSDR